eukprot:scaffold3827_cov179-Cylindrotheca_fusiformis.AAC.24
MMLTSWLEIPEDSDFSLRNIPFGVCLLPSNCRRCVTAIGNSVVDLSVLQDADAFSDIAALDPDTFSHPTLNEFLEHPSSVWKEVRLRIVELFATGQSDLLSSNENLKVAALHDLHQVAMCLPVSIGEYTDFYSSREHATNVGIMYRGKDNALQPNWLHLPVGYHGRASTIICSGQSVVRPCGQLQIDPKDPKQGSTYGPCQRMDFELEVGFLVGGPPNDKPLSIEEAKDRIFGFVLVNDWSARDIQKWEYVPLGPFTSKNFATTVSPWIIPTEALEAFACPTSAAVQNPTPLEYLQDANYTSYDVHLSVGIQSGSMKQPHIVCRSNFANLYWNAAQQLCHHSVTGCVMNAGDLLASGTISGETDESFGSMLELSWNGSRTVELGSSGETRRFLEDGDTVVMNGFCYKDGYGRVGFGECSGNVLPAGSIPEPRVSNKSWIGATRLKLYSYWRSSSCWRVRIALAAKGVSCEIVPVDLKAEEHKREGFLAKNPLGQVPVLEYTVASGGVKYITQSISIIEFLDLCFPKTRSLIPKDTADRFAATEMVEIINSGIQPLQNDPMITSLEILSEGKIAANDFAKNAISRGFKAIETLIQTRKKNPRHRGPFALGSFSPTIVDACLIPQLYNARRLGMDINEFPVLSEIDRACSHHSWFVPAHASVQVDAEDCN